MIFTILKVIGIILLVVLALILTALLCVLFVPVKYRAVGSFDNTDIRAKAPMRHGFFICLHCI